MTVHGFYESMLTKFNVDHMTMKSLHYLVFNICQQGSESNNICTLGTVINMIHTLKATINNVVEVVLGVLVS